MPGDHSNHVHVAKMLTRITGMIVAVSIRIPIIANIICVRVVSLVETCVINRLGYALQTHEEHGSYQQIEEPVVHPAELTRYPGVLLDAVHENRLAAQESTTVELRIPPSFQRLHAEEYGSGRHTCQR